jgi:hypothetical protein
MVAAASSAQAMCIDNRSDRNVAVVRSAPFNEMTEIYQTIVPPRGFQCETMPARADGATPVSVYVIDNRGKCQVATGCYYENRDDGNVFVGAGTMGCVTSFNVSNCAAR